MNFWYEKSLRLKKEQAIIKLSNDDGSFRESVIIPTTYYPLNGEYEVFHYKNTRILQDEKALEIFDSIKYKYGFCYDNAQRLIKALQSQGYNAKTYVGWVFVSGEQYPIHHCWVVLENDIVMDLSDDFTAMLTGENGKQFAGKNKDEVIELTASFASASRKVKNSIRCSPVGTPTPFMLYVGSECEPEYGRNIYNRLIAKFPHHKANMNCDANGLNATQKYFKSKGLM